ncbi:MAG TPA: 16S rRNA (cytosine(1402)-N(4))-methyltransferase RsmH [Polyangiaceae bacterium]|jgi:16S rRNA (cytosine1402-N4)-methyltransferase|nr:16S rRNA (cytosine(1402)-N(4))-methyltransferase RsmH [Polyangiaceae bacterium]
MMAAARIDSEPPFVHASVMLSEVLAAFGELTEGVLVDVTLGGAGHSAALLGALPGVRLFGFDRDPRAVAASRAVLAPFGERAVVEHASFAEVAERLDAHGLARIDGILADLGVSSEQLTDVSRGMSFRTPGPIDMRMDPSRGETARELIERVSQEELADIIYELGEERASRRIARCIKQALAAERLTDTLELRRAIVRAVGPRRVGGIDPATRTFQALRMAVNAETSELRALLALARQRLRSGGTAAFISFHSIEDRAVKRELVGRNEWEPLTKKPRIPSDQEIEQNARSRSAKLRTARRLPPSGPGEEPE